MNSDRLAVLESRTPSRASGAGFTMRTVSSAAPAAPTGGRVRICRCLEGRSWDACIPAASMMGVFPLQRFREASPNRSCVAQLEL